MNILQHLPEAKHGLILVTLNPPFPVDPAKTIGTWKYDHPMMTQQSVSAQSLLPLIQNVRRISHVGAWTKYGFHEDGFTSAMRLVTSSPFNVTPPFPLKPGDRSTGTHGLGEVVGRGVVSVVERTRRDLEPIWKVIAIVVGLILMWVERVMQTCRLDTAGGEVERLRECWIPGQDKKRV